MNHAPMQSLYFQRILLALKMPSSAFHSLPVPARFTALTRPCFHRPPRLAMIPRLVGVAIAVASILVQPVKAGHDASSWISPDPSALTAMGGPIMTPPEADPSHESAGHELHHAHEHESFYAGLRHTVLVLVVVAAAIPVAHFALRPRLSRSSSSRRTLPFAMSAEPWLISSPSTSDAPQFASLREGTPMPLPIGSSKLDVDDTLSSAPSPSKPEIVLIQAPPAAGPSHICVPTSSAASPFTAAAMYLKRLFWRRKARFETVATRQPVQQPPKAAPQPQPPPSLISSTLLHRFHLSIPHVSARTPLDDPILGFPFRVSLPYTLLVVSLAIAIAAPVLVCISLTFRFRKDGALHADLQWAVHSLTWLATWGLLPLAYFDAETLSGRIWAAHAASAGVGSSSGAAGTRPVPASTQAEALERPGVRQRHVTAPASTLSVSPPALYKTPPKKAMTPYGTPSKAPGPVPPTRAAPASTRSRASETLATLAPVYALTLVMFVMVPYALFTSLTHVVLVAYALIHLAPLGLQLVLRPLFTTLKDPEAAYRAAIEAANAECERIETAIGVLDVRIMAAESELGMGRVRREQQAAASDKPASEPDSGVGMGDDEVFVGPDHGPLDSDGPTPSLVAPIDPSAERPRLPKLTISTAPTDLKASDPVAAAELAAVQAQSPTHSSTLLSLSRDADPAASPMSRTTSADLLPRPLTPVSAATDTLATRSSPYAETLGGVSRRRTVSSPGPLPTTPTWHAGVGGPSPDARAARRVRELHKHRQRLQAALAHARAAQVRARETSRRTWVARAWAAGALGLVVCGLACAASGTLAIGGHGPLALGAASGVVVVLVARGLVARVVDAHGAASRAGVVARVAHVVVVCGALGEAAEVVVMGPWAACSNMVSWGGWVGRVVVPCVLVGGFWVRVAMVAKVAVKQSMGNAGYQ